MKTVWILEMKRTQEEWEEQLIDSQEMLEMCVDEQSKHMALRVIHTLEEKIANYPDGHFEGIVGRSIYKQFTQDAKDCMRRNKGRQFRVVKAEVEDDAKYWIKYKNPVENTGVLKYLYATAY